MSALSNSQHNSHTEDTGAKHFVVVVVVVIVVLLLLLLLCFLFPGFVSLFLFLFFCFCFCFLLGLFFFFPRVVSLFFLDLFFFTLLSVSTIQLEVTVKATDNCSHRELNGGQRGLLTA